MFDLAGLTVPDTYAITRRLSIEAVAAGYGVVFGEEGLACCPFHGDSTASLSSFIGDDGKRRLKCHGCGWGGDVIDFVRAYQEELSFGQALVFCQSLLDEGLTAAAPAVGAADPRHAAQWAHAAASAHAGLRLDLLEPLVPAGAAAWVGQAFWLGHLADGTLVMPHAGPDGAVDAVKIRVRGEKRSMPGSRLRNLYGVWHYPTLPERVVLCEGESDTWTVAWYHRGTGTAVLGLPRGVGSRVEPSWREQLAGRDVTLLFDGDKSGRRGMVRWKSELDDVCTVRTAVLPDGCDARSATRDDVMTALESAGKASWA